MTPVTSLIMLRVRTPFLLLIAVYAVSILGMVMIPGIDDQGNPWRMSIFHAFYYVSYTATTIGFGEIPYPLTDAQRMWSFIIIYMSVITWFYALGKILTLIQDISFKQAVTTARFKRHVEYIAEPFYLVCGLGDIGNALVRALIEENIGAVVIERKPELINESTLIELNRDIPSIHGDASDPAILKLAGIEHQHCQGVIAVTASDDINLKIAITSKLLHPDIKVVCRSEIKEHEENMLSFKTDYIVNPFEIFANIFAMAMHSPSLHLIYEWLTGSPNTKLSEPVYFRYGDWIICGYGRFGKILHSHLRAHNIPTTIIDPSRELRDEFYDNPENRDVLFLIGTGTDAASLNEANVQNAAGLVSGSDNDTNNLSIIMTARDINPELFIVTRRNQAVNAPLFQAVSANIIMRPSEVLARKIRSFLLVPLLVEYLNLASQQDTEWSNITISRMSGILGDVRPSVWSIKINMAQASAVCKTLKYGRIIRLRHIIQDPMTRRASLRCVPLMIKREGKDILMPEVDEKIYLGDELLFCGQRDVKQSMHLTISVVSTLNYVMTFKEEPDSLIWRKMYQKLRKDERRESSRQ